MNDVVNLKEKLDRLDEFWSPRVVGEVDEAYVKIAKLKGSLAWHKHEEDELFLVVNGRLRIEMTDRTVELKSGEMFVVPKGVPHNPVADEECHVLVIEKKTTKHTGDLNIETTRSIEDQLRPI